MKTFILAARFYKHEALSKVLPTYNLPYYTLEQKERAKEFLAISLTKQALRNRVGEFLSLAMKLMKTK